MTNTKSLKKMGEIKKSFKGTSKYVVDYWVLKFESGIVEILFNLKTRWLNFHQINNFSYVFTLNEDIDNGLSGNEYQNCIENINEDNLPFDKNTIYIPSSSQDKDQVYFYFIPMELVTQGKVRENVLQRKTKSYE